MKFHREEYLELMTFGCPDRQMFVELFGPLVGLEEEWRAQGATDEEIALTAFDWDYVPVVDCGGCTKLRGGQKLITIEDTGEYLIQRDSLGRTLKLCKGVATIPLPLDFPVKDMDDWLRVKPMYEFHEDRIDWEAVERAKKQQSEGALVYGLMPGAYDVPRDLMGEENACLSYYLQPELMHDIMKTLTDTSFRVFERITDVLTIDQLSVHEDLAGKSGPLLGPKQMEEFVKSYFQKVWGLLSSRGTRLFDMDSDGDVNPLIDILLECGLTGMLPFEPAAGMDIVETRKKYGHRLAVRGGIDKHILREDKKAIEKELEYKMQPLMQEGGTVFGLDHRIPNGTPLENYRYYVDLGREILGLPARTPDKQGWRRMAF